LAELESVDITRHDLAAQIKDGQADTLIPYHAPPLAVGDLRQARPAVTEGGIVIPRDPEEAGTENELENELPAVPDPSRALMPTMSDDTYRATFSEDVWGTSLPPLGCALTGAIRTGSWTRALQGAVTGAIFGYIGGQFQLGNKGWGDSLASTLRSTGWSGAGKALAFNAVRSAAHAVAGGVVSVVRGGKFAVGALTGFASKFVGAYANFGTATFAQSFLTIGASAVLGGAVAEMAGIEIDLEAIQLDLDRRRPGQSDIVTQRKEEDQLQILSGVFEGPYTLNKSHEDLDLSLIESNDLRCPDPEMAEEMIAYIKEIRKAGDTVGGVISCVIEGVPLDSTTVRELVHEDYIQHNPFIPTGREPFIGLFPVLKEAGTTAENVRLLQDGDFVIAHNIWRNAQPFGSPEMVSFDILRVDENGKIAEHWDAMTELVKETASGRTQTDGPTEIKDLDKTEENKALAKSLIEDVLMGKAPEKITDHISAETYHQHNPQIKDGLEGINEAIEYLTSKNNMFKYTKIHKVLGE
ncbi:unnamed protein product, partial [Cyprideis torosa]